MIIEKIAHNIEHYKKEEYYYESAREGMFDLFNNMKKAGMINTLFLPGYIGWSPKEGSGIFDPVNNIEGIAIKYYKMTSDLNIDVQDLATRLKELKNDKFAVLTVNYFGFVDPRLQEISHIVHDFSGWLIEDNAHGFFTDHLTSAKIYDATFFSLHKMFPFKNGGSLLINNNKLKKLSFTGHNMNNISQNPYLYDVYNIAMKRKENYMMLEKIISNNDTAEYFIPLKKGLEKNTVPQTFPIIIKKGNRDKIYQSLNDSGYGVVSLYHTLIEPLRNIEYQESVSLSKCILNLPVHQDVDNNKYPDMIKLLKSFCNETSS